MTLRETLPPNQTFEVDSEVQDKEIVKGFLERYRYLHEYRIQKLVYITEVVSVYERGKRLTEFDFKPYLYGAYADNLPQMLERLAEDGEVDTKKDTHHGKKTTAYMSVDESGKEISATLTDEVGDIIERVHEATKSMSNEELAKWSKETWLYQEEGYGKPMDFSRLMQRSEREIEEELKQGFPDLELSPQRGSGGAGSFGTPS
ncbi:type II toxin-antitoxin system antitoxin SocA domain-containing protein [Halobaculum sp. P14]|uniref:type II toxin-antitoxin system antitoxin SocA domain-containing protein n=1 Tax=Halobaculum sp. P14 TaxID=3421638 RepID=UPI003EC09F2F